MARSLDRYIRFNVNIHPGGINDPVGGGHPFIDIERYAAQARLAEQNLLDAVFLADYLAVSPDQKSGFNRALDPVTILPALARETTHIGLVGTMSTTYTTPYALARAVLSIDHISGGRAGWNIVTTMDSRAAGNFGREDYPDRVTRYRRAGEFAQVVVALWRSWQQDLDETWDLDNLTASPIDHHGEFFDVAGPLQVPGSRQGIPVIYQAGGSDHGLELAARYADAVFTIGVEEGASAVYRTRLNQRARQLRGSEVQVLPGLGITVGSTEAEVAELIGNAEAALSDERLRRVAQRYGIDFNELDPDAPIDPDRLAYEESTRSVGFAQGGVDLARARPISLRRWIILGGGGHRHLFGTPESIADDLIGWVARGAADGFNVNVGDLEPFVEHIVPLLQERGVYRREYAGSTLRDNITQHAG